MMNIFRSPKQDHSVQSVHQLDFNDPLVRKLQQHLYTEEQQLFMQSFYEYLNYDEENDFVIDLDDIYQWIGYTTKQYAKDMLVQEFQEGVDYKVALTENGKKTYLMTISTFDGFCMASYTEKGKTSRKYYRKMVNVMKEYTKEQLQAKELEAFETKQLLEAKEHELQLYKEKTYEEIEKTDHVYILKTDLGYKIGKTKHEVTNRKKGLQTGNVNDIEIILDYRTSNADLLERVVHYILARYRCNSNREFFDCNVDYMKMVVAVCGKTIDTLKSAYQHISEEELRSHFENHSLVIPGRPKPHRNNSIFYNWLDENIEYKEDAFLQAKDVCQSFLEKDKIHSKESSRYKTEVEKWIKENHKNCQWKYRAVYHDGKTSKGWKGFCIKNSSVTTTSDE